MYEFREKYVSLNVARLGDAFVTPPSHHAALWFNSRFSDVFNLQIFLTTPVLGNGEILFE